MLDTTKKFMCWVLFMGSTFGPMNSDRTSAQGRGSGARLQAASCYPWCVATILPLPFVPSRPNNGKLMLCNGTQNFSLTSDPPPIPLGRRSLMRT